MRIIVGLGNPGRRYADTRHNAGWLAADRLAGRCGAGRQQYAAGGMSLPCEDGGGRRFLLFKPLRYMNRSGEPVSRLLGRREADAGDLLVLVDDVNLPLGSLRLRTGGSSGGHRGLESIGAALGTSEFARLRMGVGPCPEGVDLRRFVLSPFAPGEREAVDRMVESAADAALCWLRQGAETAMDRYNRTVEP